MNPTQSPSSSAVGLADPACKRQDATLQDALVRAGTEPDVWVFGYASLIWRPEFQAVESCDARLLGWHRALRMLSRVNRGTPERPGLVFALLAGGACRGMVFRLSRETWREDLTRLWDREMPLAVYDPRWLPCRTPHGIVRALTFTLDRLHPSHTGVIGDEAMVEILRHAHGRFGSTLDYLLETARGLRKIGIHDREIERLVTLAVKAGITHDSVCSHPARRSALPLGGKGTVPTPA